MTFYALRAGSLGGSEYARHEWFSTIPNDTLLEDILKPAWWVHHAQTLKPMQRVELVTEDCLLDVELRVTKVADGLVWVNPLRVTENKQLREHLGRERMQLAEARAADVVLEMPDELKGSYKVGHAPGNNLWFVTLVATKTTIHKGARTKAEAIAWAIDHSKKALAA